MRINTASPDILAKPSLDQTPKTEVDLCGHATLAAALALGEEGLLLLSEDGSVTFSTRSGERVLLAGRGNLFSQGTFEA